MTIEPFFLNRLPYRLFSVHAAPVTALKGNILYVHPFAEEMNRSRHIELTG